MFVITPVTKKGGAGKSTAIAHAATAMVEAGGHPLIIDCDTSISSLYIWGRAGRADLSAPAIVKADADTLDQRLAEAGKAGHDWVFIDVPAGGGELVARVASLAHLVLIPVRASTFDVAATKQTIEMLRRTVDETEPIELASRSVLGKAAIVLNGVPLRPTKSWRADIEGALLQCGAGGIDIIGELGERAAYRSSLEKGRGVTEEGKDKAAIEEVNSLCDEIRKRAARRAAAVERLKVKA